MYTISTIEWTLLPFLSHFHQSSLPVSFYLKLSALPQLVPLAANTFLGLLSSKIGSVRTLAIAYTIVALGVSALILAPGNLPVVTIGIVMYSTIQSLRVVRIAIIADLVSSEQRTAALAWHLAVAPVAALAAPVTWHFVQLWPTTISIPVFSWDFIFDRFTLNYSIALIMLITIVFTTYTYQPILEPRIVDTTNLTNPNVPTKDCEYGATNMLEEHTGTVHTRSTLQWMLIFIPLSFFPNLGLCASAETFQPALMLTFGKDESYVATAYIIVAVVAFLPPLCMAALSNIMSDRAMVVFGLSLKVIGGLLYTPLLGGVSPTRVVIGFVLFVQASSFFTTALLSMFTKKVVQPRKRAAAMGILWSISNGVPALIQVLLANQLMQIFGTWTFCLAFLPTPVVLALVLSPWFGRIAAS